MVQGLPKLELHLSGYVKNIECGHEVRQNRRQLWALADTDHLLDRAQGPAAPPGYPGVLHHLAHRDALLGILQTNKDYQNGLPSNDALLDKMGSSGSAVNTQGSAGSSMHSRFVCQNALH